MRTRGRSATIGSGEEGVSEVLGTIVLLAGTILVIGVAAVMISSADEETIPPRLDVIARAEPGDGAIRLVHAGGEPFDLGNVHAHVAVEHETWFEGKLGALGERWRIGDMLEIDGLPGPLEEGAPVDVTLYRPSGTIAVVSFQVGGEGSGIGLGSFPEEAFKIKLFFESATGSEPTSIGVSPPEDILVFARVEHPLGRQAVSRVDLDASELGGSSVSRMYDDGTNGDAEAGDGVYTRNVHVSSSLRPFGAKEVTARATDAGGNTRVAGGTVHLSGARILFDTSLIEEAAIRTSKHPGPNGDKVLTHVKLRLVQDVVTRDGIDYALAGGWFAYLPVYPGQAHDPIALDVIRSGEGCDDRVVVLSFPNEQPEAINGYDRYEEPVFYFIDLQWEEIGNSKEYFRSPLDSSNDDQYFILTRAEDEQVIKNGEWPASFDDCLDE